MLKVVEEFCRLSVNGNKQRVSWCQLGQMTGIGTIACQRTSKCDLSA